MADGLKPLEAHHSTEEVPGTRKSICVGLDSSGNFRDAGNWCGRVGNVIAGI